MHLQLLHLFLATTLAVTSLASPVPVPVTDDSSGTFEYQTEVSELISDLVGQQPAVVTSELETSLQSLGIGNSKMKRDCMPRRRNVPLGSDLDLDFDPPVDLDQDSDSVPDIANYGGMAVENMDNKLFNGIGGEIEKAKRDTSEEDEELFGGTGFSLHVENLIIENSDVKQFNQDSSSDSY